MIALYRRPTLFFPAIGADCGSDVREKPTRQSACQSGVVKVSEGCRLRLVLDAATAYSTRRDNQLVAETNEMLLRGRLKDVKEE